jgi:glycosyltransferase involved in cell wall biosynthesis
MKKISISIIIATCNREAILWTSVEKAIVAIENSPTEIIVVNDGDHPLIPPAAIAGKIQCFNNPSKGVSLARNFGAAQSRGSVLFFIDDDMWIVPEAIDWIKKNLAEYLDCGSVYNLNWEYPPGLYAKLTTSKVGRFILDTNYNCMWGRMHEKGTQPASGLYPFYSIASCSLVMHKNIFCKLNGYNEQLVFQGEDIDLSNRIRALSIPIYAVFDVTLFHNHQDRLEIHGFLGRSTSGYRSEFSAIKMGIIEQDPNSGYKGMRKQIFEIFRKSEPGLIILYKILPNLKILRPLNNRLIGTLSGLQRYKEWVALEPTN